MSAAESTRWWAQLTQDPPERPQGRRSASAATYDVVVVGAGVAGYVAAVTAADAGCSVVLLEAGERAGGTTFKAGGGYWVPGNSLMRRRGREDDRDAALEYMASLSFPDAFDAAAPRYGLAARDFELLEVYYDTATEAVDALERSGALRTREFQSFHGEHEGMVSYHSQTTLDWGRHLAPRAADGSQELGSGLIVQLAQAAAQRGVELVVRHRVVDVLTDAGAVVGVRAETPDGVVELHARRGVVFGSGGFTHDPELVERVFEGPIAGGGAVPTNRGDFLTIGERLGAELGNLAHGWLVQVPLEAALERREQDELLVFMPSGDAMVFVDADGRRVVNEKEIYQERTRAHFVRDADGGFPQRLLLMVFDQTVLDDPRPWSNTWPAGRAGAPYVISGETFPQLAAAIGDRLESLADRTDGFALAPGFADELVRTVARFDRFAAAGRDEDFARGETLHEIDWNRPARPGHAGNPTMHPFTAEGPYYCVILAAATLDTSGGPRVDGRAQVVRPDGSPIAGLYGAGNCIASPSAQAYWSGGSTIGPAIAFGYLAGRNVAEGSPTGLR